MNTATHGADQLMVQRYLSARSQRQAATALVASGFIILAQFAFFLLIGVSLWVFYQVFPPSAGVGAAGAGVGSSDEVFTYFIVHYLPTGVLGLVVAAVFSAAMGTLAGSLNSSASTIVNDLYRPFTGRKDERHLMQTHTVIGEQMLRGVTFLQGAGLGVVRSHHERWDGHGYPDRRAGTDIPVAARVFAVADALDAMTSDRPYRDARGWSEAGREILEQLGRQFDPDVVDAFQSREPALRKIHREFTEPARRSVVASRLSRSGARERSFRGRP